MPDASKITANVPARRTAYEATVQAAALSVLKVPPC